MKAICALMVTVSLFLLLGLGGIIENSPISPEILHRFFIILGIFAVFATGLIVLEKRTTLAGKCALKNNQYKYSTNPINYASSFRLGQPVVTTDEYYDGKGYHAFIEKIDRVDNGRPFKIRMCGSLGFDWVSSGEIVPDKEMEATR